MNKRPRRFPRAILSCCLLLAASVAQAAMPPSSELLPEDTLLMARIPAGQQYYQTLKSQTKLGAVIFTDARQKNIEALLAEKAGPLWEKFQQELKTYDLSSSEISELFAGECGVSLHIKTFPDKPTVLVVMGWFEPSEKLRERAYKALLKSLTKDPTHIRKDIELGGSEVTLVNNDEDTFGPVFLNRQGPRILMAHSIVFLDGKKSAQPPAEPQALAEPKMTAAVHEHELTVSKELFGQFINAHSQASGGGRFTAKMLATPGMREALPEGQAVFEFFLDTPHLSTLAMDQASPDAKRIAKTLGLFDIGPMAMRQTFENHLGRAGMFVSVPQPRTGLLTLLDQPALPAAPADWVPSDCVQYTHLSFDLGRAYQRVRELVVAEYGPGKEAEFQSAETAVTNSTMSTLPAILSSLGQQHTMAMFPFIASATENPKAPPMSRFAMVWQVKDQELWKRLLTMLAPFTAMSQGMVVAAEEQGFTGYRAQGPYQGGLFLGQQKLVLGVGANVCETVMANLRTPPAKPLQNSQLQKRAGELLTLRPGSTYQLIDLVSYLQSTCHVLKASLQQTLAPKPPAIPGQPEAAPVSPSHDAQLLEKLEAIIPSDAELEKTMGVGVSQSYTTPQGVVFQTVSEMP